MKFANRQPILKCISPRLPESMLARLKSLANERDVPYQSLIKMILAEAAELFRHIGSIIEPLYMRSVLQ